MSAEETPPSPSAGQDPLRAGVRSSVARSVPGQADGWVLRTAEASSPFVGTAAATRRIDCSSCVLKVMSWYLDSAYLDKLRGRLGDTITPPVWPQPFGDLAHCVMLVSWYKVGVRLFPGPHGLGALMITKLPLRRQGGEG